MRVGAALLTALVAAGVLVGCGGVPASPLGEECSWPAEVRSQRDRLAVLYDEGTKQLSLLDVASGALRARCFGVESAAGRARGTMSVSGTAYVDRLASAAVPLSPVSPDLRWAATRLGLVELSSGTVTAVGSDDWAIAAPLANSRVLLARRFPEGHSPSVTDYQFANTWCVLPAANAEVSQCAPVSSSTAPGTPVPHPDGTVGWAESVAVPMNLGVTPGWAVTDGTRLVRGEVVAPPGPQQRSGVAIDASGLAGVVDREDLATALNVSRTDPRVTPLTWFRATGISRESVTTKQFSAPVAIDDVLRRTGGGISFSLRTVHGLSVSGDGSSVALVLPASKGVAVVRVGVDGSVNTVATSERVGTPKILAWPDAT